MIRSLKIKYKKIIKNSILLFFSITTNNTYCNSIEEILQMRLNKINIFCAKFQQKTINNLISFEEYSEGNCLIKKSNCFKWYIDKPYKILIISNGKNIWLYNPIINHVNTFSLKEIQYKLPFFIITEYNSKILKFFNITKEKDCFTLLPKKKDFNFQHFKIKINNSGIIKNIDYLDTNNYHISIKFDQYKLCKIKKKEFDFIIPKESTLDTYNNFLH